MNKTKVTELLDLWQASLELGETASRKKVLQSQGGLQGRIRRTTGLPVIFDHDTYESQLKLQDRLCVEVPDRADLIRSQPEIMDGYEWTRGDFIDLYYAHFRMVVDKLRTIVDKAVDV